MTKMKFSVGAISDVGLQRVNNEDNLFIPGIKVKEKDVKIYSLKTEESNEVAIDGTNTLFAVCDGMGGHNAGEDASYMAVDAIQAEYNRLISYNTEGKIKEEIDKFLVDVNQRICKASLQEPDKEGMGCTFCGLYFYGGNRVIPINVGDSRIYRLKGSKLMQMSVDHTDSLVGKGALTRYLGLPEEYGEISADFGDKSEILSGRTRFLLCSDGLSDMVGNDDILFHLKNEKNPSSAAEKLVDVAKRMGGDDNITVVVIDAEPKGKIFSRIIRKPVAYIAAAAVIAALAGGYALYSSNSSTEYELTEGESLSIYNENLNNAGTAEEIIEGLDSKITAVENNLNVYIAVQNDCKGVGINGVDEYKAAYLALNNAIYDLNTEITNVKTQLNRIKEIKKDSGTEKLALAEELRNFAGVLDEKQLIVEEASKAAQAAAREKRQEDNASASRHNAPSGGGNKAVPPQRRGTNPDSGDAAKPPVQSDSQTQSGDSSKGITE